LGFFGFRPAPEESSATVLIEPESSEFELTGKVHITSRLTGDSGKDSFIFDTEDYEFKKFLNLDSAFVGLVKISPNGEKAVFHKKENTDDPSQIYTKDLSSGEIKQITDNQIYSKQGFDWSSDGQKIVYTGIRADRIQTVEQGDLYFPEVWEIYITDLEGNNQFITYGYFPMFSPDGEHLLYLKNNGLHLVNLESGESSNIWSLLAMIGENLSSHSRSMHLGLSQDKRMLAWSRVDAGNEQVTLIKIVSWEPFSAELTGQIPVQGFWPVFSPDNRYLAIEEVDDLNEEGRNFINPRLVFYDLETFNREATLDLGRYDQMFLWITDWSN